MQKHCIMAMKVTDLTNIKPQDIHCENQHAHTDQCHAAHSINGANTTTLGLLAPPPSACSSAELTRHWSTFHVKKSFGNVTPIFSGMATTLTINTGFAQKSDWFSRHFQDKITSFSRLFKAFCSSLREQKHYNVGFKC